MTPSRPASAAARQAPSAHATRSAGTDSAADAPPRSLPLAQLLVHAGAAVSAVLAGRSLSDVLPGVPAAARPGTQALAFHALRWLGSAQAALRSLAPRRPPPEVEGVLLVALSLLRPQVGPAAPGDAGVSAATVAEATYPAHTVVNQAVTALRRAAPRQAGFANAVLRRFLREPGAQPAAEAQDAPARWQHPAWWVQALQQDWPAQWAALLRANQAPAPMDLRVNARHGDAAWYLNELAAAGLAAEVISPHGLRLNRPVAVQRLPGFEAGWVSVQDAHAQQAAPLLIGEGAERLPAGAHVLDACAAPGGKTAHLLEAADLDVLALDVDATRLDRVRDTLARLKLQARLQAADAAQPSVWWDGRPFDAILLDAPCSGSGVVRRHPDIRWLRRASDIDVLARTQAALLDALWPLLAPGGRLVYATCSVFKAEGERQVEAFLQRQPGARRAAAPGHLLPLADNVPTRQAEQAHAGDGFFYARLDKAA